jgi:hypothetical protein
LLYLHGANARTILEYIIIFLTLHYLIHSGFTLTVEFIGPLRVRRIEAKFDW